MKNLFKTSVLAIVICFTGIVSYAQSAQDIIGVYASSKSIMDYKASYIQSLQANAENLIITYYDNAPEKQNFYQTAIVHSNTSIGIQLQEDITTPKDNNEEYITKEFALSNTEEMIYWQMHQLKRDKIIVIGLNESTNIVSILSYSRDYYNSHILGK